MPNDVLQLLKRAVVALREGRNECRSLPRQTQAAALLLG